MKKPTDLVSKYQEAENKKDEKNNGIGEVVYD